MKLLTGIIELKDGWFVRLPYPMTEMELAHLRFDPGTIALIVGTSLQAAGQIQQGRVAEAEGEAQEEWAEYNAKVMEADAAERMAAAKMEESRVAREQKMARGVQKAAFAKAGVTLEGSPLEVIADTYEQYAIDRGLVLRQGLLASRGLRQQAQFARYRGQIARAKGKAAKRASYLQAFGTMGMAAGSAWMRANAPNPPPGYYAKTGPSNNVYYKKY